MSTKNKKSIIKKSETIKIRISLAGLAATKSRALKYCEGDLSKWVRYCLDNCPAPRKK